MQWVNNVRVIIVDSKICRVSSELLMKKLKFKHNFLTKIMLYLHNNKYEKKKKLFNVLLNIFVDILVFLYFVSVVFPFSSYLHVTFVTLGRGEVEGISVDPFVT